MRYFKSIQLILTGLALSCAFPGLKRPPPPSPKKSFEQSRAPVKNPLLESYCREVEASFRVRAWGKSRCSKRKWSVYRKTSVRGRPLVFQIFGDLMEKKRRPENFSTTLILCAVHGDEITPVKFCYDVLDYLEEGKRHQISLANRLVVVAPLVSPDSYLRKRPSRTNARGVDVNRNFPTADFHSRALKVWRGRYRSNPRRYPGTRPMSEPETAFQVDLIETFAPDKIVSVHAPLTMLDYDGPEGHHDGGIIGPAANQLLINMSEKARGYRIKNYPFFPGSLGNWAGNERNIPTFTLELPSSDSRNHQRYWKQFRDSILSAVMHGLGEENGEEDLDLALKE